MADEARVGTVVAPAHEMTRHATVDDRSVTTTHPAQDDGVVDLRSAAREAPRNDRAASATPERAWPRVDAVVLMWRAGEKTERALRSLLGSGYPNLRIIVVDNGADDGSGERVWQLFKALQPDAQRIDVGLAPVSPGAPDGPLFLRSAVNRGYSGGYNLGLDVVRRTGRAEYFWQFNNDNELEPGCIEALVTRCEADPAIGLVGCTQHVYDRHGTLQVAQCGGFRYRRLLANKVLLPLPERLSAAQHADIERGLWAVVGSAVFGPVRFLHDVGLYRTDRFLYGEEGDWAQRARRAGYRLGWAPAAVIRTVHDGTLEEVRGERWRVLTRYLGARARVRFALAHDRWLVPVRMAEQVAAAAVEVSHGRPKVAAAGLRGMVDALAGRHRYFPDLGPALYPGKVYR